MCHSVSVDPFKMTPYSNKLFYNNSTFCWFFVIRMCFGLSKPVKQY